MVVYGCAFGALMFYFTGCQDQFPLVDQTPWWMLILVFLWCCTIVPMPASWDIRGWAETNPLNGPVWSLQWEYLANILYALVIRRFTKLWLTVCVVLFGVMTLLLCLNVDWLGVWENRTAEAFTVIGGWSLSPDQLLIGSTRLLYPFFAGLLLSRANRLIKVRGGFWLCSALIAAVPVMPRVGGADSLWMNGVYEAVVILLLFPSIVSVGAGSRVTGRSSAVCRFFGELSYPLYITHFPLVYLQKSWVYYHPDAPLSTHVAVAVCVYVMAVANAWAAYKLYDLPVRVWLKARLFPAKGKSRR